MSINDERNIFNTNIFIFIKILIIFFRLIIIEFINKLDSLFIK